MIVAGGILSAAEHHLVSVHLLGLVRNDIAFALLGDDMADVTFLGLDIISDLVGLVALFAVMKDRFAVPFLVDRVVHAVSVDEAGVHVHTDEIRLQFHRFVFEVTLAVEESGTVAHHDHGVGGLIVHRRFQFALFLGLNTV